MNLMLYKDGRLVMNEQGKPLEGQKGDLRNLYAYVTDPQDGDTLVYNAAQQKWVNGAGGSGVLCVDDTETETGSVLGNTWQEIFDVFANGGYAYVRSSSQNGIYIGTIMDVYEFDNEYIVNVLFSGGSDVMKYKTSSADGYPAFTEE